MIGKESKYQWPNRGKIKLFSYKIYRAATLITIIMKKYNHSVKKDLYHHKHIFLAKATHRQVSVMLLRAVRSFVSRKEDKKETPPSGESHGNDSPTTQRIRTTLNKDFQNQVDKLKSFWTLYTNMSEESDRAQQLSKILPLFISSYEGQEFKLISET